MSNGNTFAIDLEPVGRRVELPEGESLLDAAQSAGVEIISLCGGIGNCDSCRVRIVSGQLTPPTVAEEAEFSPDELVAGWRLACQAEPLSDVKIDIPPESLTTPQRLQVEGEAAQITLDPVIRAVDVTLTPPTLHDLRADTMRLIDVLAEQDVHHPNLSLPVLQALSDALRDNNWSVRLAVRDDKEVVAVLPPETPLLGLAVDIGTTGMAAYLVDLSNGEILAKTGAMNPQIAYGEDVVSRIVYINEHPQQNDTLQKRVVVALNELLHTLCADTGSTSAQVVEAVIVGNTAMHHILAGLPVKQLGEAPYVPAVSEAMVFAARDIGLELAPGANVYLPPNIAGYVGADHVAMLLATGTYETAQTVVAIDIGTNTEVTLAHDGRRLSCSCASGPAFEGAHIRDGMRAAAGAIERVQIVDGAIQFQTIGGGEAVGLCGSGILDAVAVMAENGVIDSRGALQTNHPFVGRIDDKPAFLLGERPVRIMRKDIAEIQLAKSAIRAGIEILLKEAGITAADVDAFIIAGAFGTYINVESARRIGMFPDLPPDRYQQVGNAAGMGATQLLVSKAMRAQVETMVAAIDYIELTTYADFQNQFVNYMSL